MSKTVRIKEHLYLEIEALARTERRSLVAQLEVLLEQALSMDPLARAKLRETPATSEPRVGRSVPADGSEHDLHFRPDFKR